MTPFPYERRNLPDRRGVLKLRLYGKRKAVRRRGEGTNTFIDCPSPAVMGMVLFVITASGLDALFTLIHLERGAIEVNPLMDHALGLGVRGFLVIKMLLTSLGAIYLSIYQLFKLGLRGLQLMSTAYLLLLVYHLILLCWP